MHTVIPQLLSFIKEKFPELHINLLEGTNELIFDKILSGEVDFGFVPNAIVPDKISSALVYKENYSLILPKNHPLTLNDFKNLEECKNESWILHPQKDGQGYMEEILKIITGYGYSPNIIHTSPNTSSVLRLVSAGLGITMMGKSTIKGFQLNIKSIELNDLPYKLNMKLVWNKSRAKELESYLKIIRSFTKKIVLD